MYLFDKQGVPWPPSGWKYFSPIKRSCGQAVFKDPASATVAGLTYNIEPNPIHTESGKQKYVYFVRIDGWNYSIHNESQEFPILSFQLKERDLDKKQKLPYISQLKVMARGLVLNENIAHRVILTSLFLMKQIDAKNVPDFERILKLYRLHPEVHKSRESRYAERADSLCCGLPSLSKDDVDFG